MAKGADREAQRELQFYTEERWNNWIRAVRESTFKLDELTEANPPSLSMDIEEDVLLACNKVLASVRRRKLSKRKAAEHIEEMKSIILAPFEPMGEDKDVLLSSVQDGLVGVFAACEKLLKSRRLDRSTPLRELVERALEMEREDDLDGALELVALIGARMLSGERLPEEVIESIPCSQVGDWLGSIEFMVLITE
ncbi:DUF2150 family protein [Methermicoccus shengliensis]|uniref:DUF2150 family protein n=1 Tax=Methermicoccus shengliensis TaxID=660064 RepID=A0A832RWK7_9EURY|nr:DUF2150 family protein [Methermicoccus shengliensis]KUK04868.1 MAG: Uncharacterized protein XD46_0399 [Euryarchaeota archaeon 55_53]KUK30496.1 MAG: Uncharacterized protein XD62_0466 [Methanosarcinales archeaon 56_1174]MDI3487908.1 hypothetical protein [Methanosarcinales archaeon]MDN5295350.1 hypothetical protein [Methanosarcinales archaeon]HIH69563.1 DUF2150 family protein [Methermicoccus shengliensis]